MPLPLDPKTLNRFERFIFASFDSIKVNAALGRADKSSWKRVLASLREILEDMESEFTKLEMYRKDPSLPDILYELPGIAQDMSIIVPADKNESP